MIGVGPGRVTGAPIRGLPDPPWQGWRATRVNPALPETRHPIAGASLLRVNLMGSDLKSTEEQGPERPRGHRWPPGVSGNPNGRPRKGDALSEAIRRRCEPDELVDIALKIARSAKQESIRLQALQWLRDSGFTKPAERHELAVERTEPQYDIERLPLAERMKLLEQVRALRVSDGSANRGSELQTGDDASEYSSGTPSCAGGEQ